jgi:hypothetical protein
MHLLRTPGAGGPRRTGMGTRCTLMGNKAAPGMSGPQPRQPLVTGVMLPAWLAWQTGEYGAFSCRSGQCLCAMVISPIRHLSPPPMSSLTSCSRQPQIPLSKNTLALVTFTSLVAARSSTAGALYGALGAQNIADFQS